MKKSAPKAKTEKRLHGTPFNEMVPQKKALFILRVIICAGTFGFVFADVMND
jgi:hypothetical protein